MKLHLLPSITLLPPPDDKQAEDHQVIEEWARGLDWVKWLLGSVRARTEVLMVEDLAWEDFADGLLRDAVGPALRAAWHAAHSGNVEGLITADAALTTKLPAEIAQRSQHAGAVLLRSTRQARYQAILGRLREAVEQGRCSGHIAIVWATVGHFFQLSLANVIAEYLHLEWDIATRDHARCPHPAGRYSIAGLTSQTMHSDSAPTLRVVDAG